MSMDMLEMNELVKEINVSLSFFYLNKYLIATILQVYNKDQSYFSAESDPQLGAALGVGAYDFTQSIRPSNKNAKGKGISLNETSFDSVLKTVLSRGGVFCDNCIELLTDVTNFDKLIEDTHHSTLNKNLSEKKGGNHSRDLSITSDQAQAQGFQISKKAQEQCKNFENLLQNPNFEKMLQAFSQVDLSQNTSQRQQQKQQEIQSEQQIQIEQEKLSQISQLRESQRVLQEQIIEEEEMFAQNRLRIVQERLDQEAFLLDELCSQQRDKEALSSKLELEKQIEILQKEKELQNQKDLKNQNSLASKESFIQEEKIDYLKIVNEISQKVSIIISENMTQIEESISNIALNIQPKQLPQAQAQAYNQELNLALKQNQEVQKAFQQKIQNSLQESFLDIKAQISLLSQEINNQALKNQEIDRQNIGKQDNFDRNLQNQAKDLQVKDVVTEQIQIRLMSSKIKELLEDLKIYESNQSLLKQVIEELSRANKDQKNKISDLSFQLVSLKKYYVSWKQTEAQLANFKAYALNLKDKSTQMQKEMSKYLQEENVEFSQMKESLINERSLNQKLKELLQLKIDHERPIQQLKDEIETLSLFQKSNQYGIKEELNNDEDEQGLKDGSKQLELQRETEQLIKKQIETSAETYTIKIREYIEDLKQKRAMMEGGDMNDMGHMQLEEPYPNDVIFEHILGQQQQQQQHRSIPQGTSHEW